MLKPLTLDRFSQGLADPQSAHVATYCAACEGEIYDADLIYMMPGGDVIHGDRRCLEDYTGAVLLSAEEIAGVSY